MESTYCIYAHKNKINNKVYIGQTCQNPENRWKSGEGYKCSPKFYNAIKKYGWNQFDHFILETGLTLEQANEKETYYIKLYNSYKAGYNMTLGGKNSKKTKEIKKKISKSNIGKHNCSKENNPMWGKHMSEEAKQKSRKKQGVQVICVETGEIFDSCHLAAVWLGLARDGHIPEVCKGKRKTAGGYHWKYYTEVQK